LVFKVIKYSIIINYLFYHAARCPATLEARHSRETITILEGDKRPVAAVADHVEVRDVEIAHDQSKAARILFDPSHNLAERLLR
jgi:hypothetical protein